MLMNLVVTLMAIALISRYCMELLLKCRVHLLDRDVKEEEQSLRTKASYGDIGFAAYGKHGKFLVNVALCFTQTGFCCVYMIFLGNNMHSIFPDVSMKMYV